jgi:hypothetical protein
MRKATVLVAVLLFAGAMTGCAAKNEDPSVATAQGGDPSGNPSVSTAAAADPRLFAQCMREHGMDWFPDPAGPGTDVVISPPAGVDQAKLSAARQACRKYTRNGDSPEGISADDQAKMLAYARCMRQNGVTQFPDPKADGAGGAINLRDLGIDPNSSTFKSAQEKCKANLPDFGEDDDDN